MTQEMCGKAVDARLPALKFVPDWLVTNKMLEKLDNAVFVTGSTIFFHEDSGHVTFFSDDMGLYTIHIVLKRKTFIRKLASKTQKP